MANFTLGEAQASRLEEAKKNYVDGSFGYWTFRVSGSDGETKFWVDHDLVENASTGSIKAAVLCHMTSSENFHVEVASPTVTDTANTEVLGSLG